jgi:hypothetical protein
MKTNWNLQKRDYANYIISLLIFLSTFIYNESLFVDMQKLHIVNLRFTN